jgi:hypothetical protein
MTLNITILTSKVIFQAADFRLSDAATGKPEHLPSTKADALQYQGWSGFLTYTGIGRVGPRHTSDFVSEWFRNRHELLFDQAVEVLREHGSAWLTRVAPRARHTFVLAAFVDSRPVAAIISNYQRWHGANQAQVATKLFVTEVRPTGGAEVIVTGVREAVSHQQRRALERLADKHSEEPFRVRTALSEINRLAAQRFPNLISEDSFVQSLDEHGRGRQDTAGDSRATPRTINDGVDLFETIRPFLDKQFGKDRWTMVASPSVTSSDRSSAPPPCELQLSNVPTGSDYQVVRMACPPGNRAQPRAVSSPGVIVGEGTPLWRGPSYPCVWRNPADLLFLEHLSPHFPYQSGALLSYRVLTYR